MKTGVLILGLLIFTSAQAQVPISTAMLPTARSILTTGVATFSTTYVNNSPTEEVTNCQTSLATSIPATLRSFDVDGSPLAPFSIPPNGSRNLTLAIEPSGQFTSQKVFFNFSCTNQAGLEGSAPTIPGVNSIILSASDEPTPDIFALAATAGNTGIVDATPAGSFAVATTNVGSASTIIASANTGSQQLPVSLKICETDPATGACVNPPAPSASATRVIGSGATPSFAVFVSSSGPIAQSAANRIFVVFADEDNVVRGATNVGVTSLTPPPPSPIQPGTWRIGAAVCFNVSLDGTRLTTIGSSCDDFNSLQVNINALTDGLGAGCDVNIDTDLDVPIVDDLFYFWEPVTDNFVSGVFKASDRATGIAVEAGGCVGVWVGASPE